MRYRTLRVTVLLCAGWGARVMADAITLGSSSGEPGVEVSLPFRFTNTNEIVGMQCDLEFPAAMVEAGSAAAAVVGFRAESRELGLGRRRVVLYSPTNEVLTGDVVLSVPLKLRPESAAGGPTVTLRNVILTNRRGQTFMPTLNYPVLDDWRRLHFGEAGLSNGSLIGDDRDPDGDGVPNLLEFIHGSDPRERQVAAMPVYTAGRKGAGGARLSLAFRVRKGTDAAALRVETSVDLLTWGSEEVELTATGEADEETMELRASVSVAGEAKRFFRLVGGRSGGTVAFFDGEGRQQSVAVDFDAVTAWKRVRFAGLPEDAPARANDADPDGDGVGNLMEFYAGTDPLDRQSSAYPRTELVRGDDGQRRVSFVFRATRGPVPGRLEVQRSPTLESWNTEAVRLESTGIGDATGVEWRAQFPAGEERMFFRLKGGQ